MKNQLFLPFLAILVTVITACAPRAPLTDNKLNFDENFQSKKQLTGTTETLAFPTAEGYGRFAKGGRGGDVYKVTNLNDSGSGSLRYGIESANDPRTIIFDISGIIELESPISINKPYLTIAGQTAPGDGICIKKQDMFIRNTHDIIIRHIRIRPGDEVGRRFVAEQVFNRSGDSFSIDELQAINSEHVAAGAEGWDTDALSIFASNNIIIDHCSASWANDETVSGTGQGLYNITIQWTMITESLNNSTHPKGIPHGYGSIIGGHATGTQPRITLHHNLYAHHYRRNPHLAGDRDGNPPGSITDFRNNVVYDWGRNPVENYTPQYTHVNFINNYFKPGPSSYRKNIALEIGSKNGHFYLSGNHLTSVPEADNDNWLMVDTSRGYTKLERPLPTPPVYTVDAQAAYERVLNRAGAFPRDEVDARVVGQVRNGGGGIINSMWDVGGWPAYSSTEPLPDSDGDGIPDFWEIERGLDPNDPLDGNLDRNDDGYTNLEEYLHWAHEQVIGGKVQGRK
jgi:pectate lyase